MCKFSTNHGKSHHRPVASVQSISGSSGDGPTACCVRASQEEVVDWALKAGGASGSNGQEVMLAAYLLLGVLHYQTLCFVFFLLQQT